jgi:carnitine O-acetyltransferase
MSTDTFSAQSQLPRLPVPSLQQTFSLYLRTLEPLVSPAQLAATKAYVDDFLRPGGLGEKLQRRLLDHAARETANHGHWLDVWWLQKAYHEWRDPLLVNSNWCMVFRDDEVLDAAIKNGKVSAAPIKGGYSVAQVKRAAHVVNKWLDIKDRLDQGTYPIDRTRAGPQCMHQYLQLFGVTRIAKPGCDTLQGGGNCRRCPTRHIVLMVNNQVYSVPVYTKDGARISDADLER